MHPLTDDMIRIVKASIGAKGRAVRDRRFHAFVDRYALKDKRGRLRRFALHSGAMTAARAFIAEHNQTSVPACLASMGCLCAGHARGNPAGDACDTSEVSAERWTRQGRTLSYNGVPALDISRPSYGPHNAILLSPNTVDAIADYVCSMLNTVNVDALTRVWMRR